MCYIFPKNFIEIRHVSQKTWVFASSILTIFINLLDVLTFTYCEKTNDVSICTIISAIFFDLDGLHKNYMKLHYYWISLFSNMKVVGESYWPTQCKVYTLKNSALEPSSWNKIIKTHSLPEESIIVCMYSFFIIL